MELINNKYSIQGINLIDLCKQYGTPLYVYDANKISIQFKTFKKAFPGIKTRVKYAAKALTNLAILKLLRKEGSELDVVSIQEAHMGLKAGFSPQQISYTPNCVSFEEIKEAIKLGVSINLDNLSVLEKLGQEYKGTVPCCIRLNPHIMAGGHSKISTGHKDSKFGISILQLDDILKIINKYQLNIIGLHIHTGSDIYDAEVFVKGAQVIFDVAKKFKDLQYIDFGSGFKVAYKEGDKITDIEYLGNRLSDAFLAFCKEYGKELELWFEPGKYMVSESGYLLVQVNVIKNTPTTTFVGVDSGLNHLIRPMMYDAYHHIVNISNPTGEKKQYTVVGYICETDTLGSDRELNEVRESDILAIKNAGAYGFSMASNYNSRFRPAEILIYNNEAKLIRKRETFEDLIKNQVDIEI